MTTTNREYAEALFELAIQAEQADQTTAGLETVISAVRQTPEFGQLLASPAIGKEKRIQALDEAARAYHARFSGDKEVLTLRYQTVSTVDDVYAEVPQLYDRLKAHQASHARAELESGQCLSGPHKDDLLAELGGLSVRSYGSQGQTRTAAISLKLAERRLMRRLLGEEPVLLLDDVLSELDAGRQDFVLNQLSEGQVFITCCETDRFTTLGRVYRVENGEITAQ